jgi:LemA protein
MAKKNASRNWLVIGAIVLVIIIIIGTVVGMYNSFVTLNQSVNAKWSEVENQYQRQADLIPTLVAVVSSAVSVETNFVKNVTDARSKWQSSSTIYDKDVSGVQMNNGISALINAVATTENYPVLRANTQYVALTDEISGTQNRITTARGRYIEAIQAYNTAITMFPGNVFSAMFGFINKDYYHAELSALNATGLVNGLP